MKKIGLGLMIFLSLRAWAAPAIHVDRVNSEKWTEEKMKRLKVAPGYQIRIFARDLGDPRGMVFDDQGVLYVSRPKHGDVLALKKDSKGIEKRTYLGGHADVSGLAIHGGKMYLIAGEKIFAVDMKEKRPVAKVLYDGLPKTGQHDKRTLGVGPDGFLYVNVGSTCNACKEDSPESATILQAALDGSGRKVFAKGLRNTQGFDWQPGTNRFFGMDHGIDLLGDDVPLEELNELQEGRDYGWPYCYENRKPNPQMASEKFDCSKTQGPAIGAQAHSAPLALKFLWGNAFVAFHGSWNREPPSGYKVVKIVFEKGEPKRFEDFVTGFLESDGKAQMGRPAGLAVTKDGHLLIADDSNGVIYEVSPVAR